MHILATEATVKQTQTYHSKYRRANGNVVKFFFALCIGLSLPQYFYAVLFMIMSNFSWRKYYLEILMIAITVSWENAKDLSEI